VRSEPELSTDRPDAIHPGDEPCRQVWSPPGFPRPQRSPGKRILGGRFVFESNSRELIRLIEAAYGNLPPQAFPDATAEFHVALQLLPRCTEFPGSEPPAPRISMDPEKVCAIVDDSNYAVIEPARHRARIVASVDMLRHAYHLRYELIEFAVFILATRGIGLVPLHAACIGRQGRGVLLLGASGAGKSTLALHCLQQGLELLAEDAVFVRPADLLATGVPNYLHVRADGLDFLEDAAARSRISRAPVIRRRSGVEKFEIDLRKESGRLAASPFQLAGAVFVSPLTADATDSLLEPLQTCEVSALLTASQSHAPSQPGWCRFSQQLMGRSNYRLRRARHPSEAVAALRRLLD